MRTYVGCYCGWRGRRTYAACECDFACGHTGYGYCPKCKGTVRAVTWMRECAANDAKYEAWASSPEGKAVLASVMESQRPLAPREASEPGNAAPEEG